MGISPLKWCTKLIAHFQNSSSTLCNDWSEFCFEGYGNGIYPGLGGGLGSMIGYPGYGMGSGMGYGGFGLPGYGK